MERRFNLTRMTSKVFKIGMTSSLVLLCAIDLSRGQSFIGTDQDNLQPSSSSDQFALSVVSYVTGQDVEWSSILEHGAGACRENTANCEAIDLITLVLAYQSNRLEDFDYSSLDESEITSRVSSGLAYSLSIIKYREENLSSSLPLLRESSEYGYWGAALRLDILNRGHRSFDQFCELIVDAPHNSGSHQIDTAIDIAFLVASIRERELLCAANNAKFSEMLEYWTNFVEWYFSYMDKLGENSEYFEQRRSRYDDLLNWYQIEFDINGQWEPTELEIGNIEQFGLYECETIECVSSLVFGLNACDFYFAFLENRDVFLTRIIENCLHYVRRELGG